MQVLQCMQTRKDTRGMRRLNMQGKGWRAMQGSVRINSTHTHIDWPLAPLRLRPALLVIRLDRISNAGCRANSRRCRPDIRGVELNSDTSRVVEFSLENNQTICNVKINTSQYVRVFRLQDL